MKSTEDKDTRLKRVDMHDYFLNRINHAMEHSNYIEASWLIYACFENRYFRTVSKYREYCKYCRSASKCNKKAKNELALATKIKCVKRLHENKVPCISESFDYSIFKDTLKWVDDRNNLMHDLLSLELYENTDGLFKANAEAGLELLLKTYEYCTRFREKFYSEGYVFVMPDIAAEACPCKPQQTEKES